MTVTNGGFKITPQWLQHLAQNETPDDPEAGFGFYTHKYVSHMIKDYLYLHRQRFRTTGDQEYNATISCVKRMRDAFHLHLATTNEPEFKRFKSLVEGKIRKLRNGPEEVEAPVWPEHEMIRQPIYDTIIILLHPDDKPEKDEQKKLTHVMPASQQAGSTS